MNKAQSILGDGKHREPNDFYATPAWATEALLQKEKFDNNILEPACGTGNISEVLIKHGYQTYSMDLIYRGYGDVEGGVDFLTRSFGSYEKYDVVTNPPFNQSLQFIIKAKEVSDGKIALLLKTQFLEGISRQKMFLDTDFPLSKVYVFSKRLTFGAKKNGGMLSFAWFVWDMNHNGPATIGWI